MAFINQSLIFNELQYSELDKGKKGSTMKSSNQVFQVERILQRGKVQEQIFYLVKWKGYSSDQATWEPLSNLDRCKEAIEEFQTTIRLIKNIEEQDGKDYCSYSNAIQQKEQMQRKLDEAKNKPKKGKIKMNKQKIQTLKEKHLSESSNQILEESRKNNKNQNESSCLDFTSEATTAQTTPMMLDLQFQVNHKKMSLQSVQKKKTKRTNQTKGNINADKVKDELNDDMGHQGHSAMTKKQSKNSSFKRQAFNHHKAVEKLQKKVKTQEQTLSQISIITEKKLDISQDQQDLQVKNLQIKLNQMQPDRLKKQSNKVEKNIEQKVKQLINCTRRYKICEQYFVDQKNQAVRKLVEDCTQKVGFKTKEYQSETVKAASCKFLDVSNSLLEIANQKIIAKLLSKELTQKMDTEGQFLYYEIELLIKVAINHRQVNSYAWVAVLNCSMLNDLNEDQKAIKYFVNIDYLKEDLWKKMFRKFTIQN